MDGSERISCRVCGGAVSTTAHACPHCGHPMETWASAGVRLATVLQRSVARLIDLAIVSLVAIIAVWLMFPEIAWPIAFGSIFIAYFTVLETRNGRTPGKSLAGITVRMADGSPITTGAALIRNLLLVIPILWPLALLVMAVDERNQGHHDKGASTVVVAG